MFFSASASVTAFKISTRDYAGISATADSAGHVAWLGDYEWYVEGQSLCRAHRTNVICVTTGNRIGRVEAGLREVANYPQLFGELPDRFVALCGEGKGHLIGC